MNTLKWLLHWIISFSYLNAFVGVKWRESNALFSFLYLLYCCCFLHLFLFLMNKYNTNGCIVIINNIKEVEEMIHCCEVIFLWNVQKTLTPFFSELCWRHWLQTSVAQSFCENKNRKCAHWDSFCQHRSHLIKNTRQTCKIRMCLFFFPISSRPTLFSLAATVISMYECVCVCVCMYVCMSIYSRLS